MAKKYKIKKKDLKEIQDIGFYLTYIGGYLKDIKNNDLSSLHGISSDLNKKTRAFNIIYKKIINEEIKMIE